MTEYTQTTTSTTVPNPTNIIVQNPEPVLTQNQPLTTNDVHFGASFKYNNFIVQL